MERKIRELPPLRGEREAWYRALIERFLERKPSTGKEKQATRYRYEAETYREYAIFLQRPAWLNNGFDFIVHVERSAFSEKRGSQPFGCSRCFAGVQTQRSGRI